MQTPQEFTKKSLYYSKKMGKKIEYISYKIIKMIYCKPNCKEADQQIFSLNKFRKKI